MALAKNAAMLLETVDLNDCPKDIIVNFKRTNCLTRISAEIINKRSNNINLNVLGTILIPSVKKYNRLVICSILNKRLPESIILRPYQKISVKFQVVQLDNSEYWPNH